MHKADTIVDTVLLSIGSIYSLANIEHILGIIILVIQLLWILTKLTVKVIEAIKNKDDLNAFDPDVENIIGSLEDIRESLTTESEEENDDNSKP